MDETRKTDKCVRWGGEEFIVVLPFCGLDKASEIAENIRAAMAAISFAGVGQVTLSMGATESVAGIPQAQFLSGLTSSCTRPNTAERTGSRGNVITAHRTQNPVPTRLRRVRR